MNLTDGLDGLAAGSSTFCFACLAIIGYWQYRHFAIYHVPDALDLALASVALAGACLGFLWWNAAPAKIFMGDTGSLSIGSGLAALCLLMNLDLLLVVIGGLFVIVTLSVVIQVISFRVFHRRVFLHGPPPPPLRADGLARDHGDRPVLDPGRAVRRPRPGHLLRGLPLGGQGLMPVGPLRADPGLPLASGGFHHREALVEEARGMCRTRRRPESRPSVPAPTRRSAPWLSERTVPGRPPGSAIPSSGTGCATRPGRGPADRAGCRPAGPSPRRPGHAPAAGRPRTGRHSAAGDRTPAGRGCGTAPAIALLVGVLCVFGLVMVGSASPVISLGLYGSPWAIFIRQVLWMGVGTGALLILSRVDYRKWRSIRGPLVVVTMGLLVLVLVPHFGVTAGGSSRWIGFGMLQLQPSELMKLALAVFAADLLTRRADRSLEPKMVIVPVLAVLGISGVLILKQPDMGTALVLSCIAFGILFMGGVPDGPDHEGPGHLRRPGHRGRAWPTPTGGTASSRSSTPGPTSPAPATRCGSRSSGWDRATSSAWVWGAAGQKWGTLPNAHTDFIFSVVGEELGLVGAVVLLGLFFALAWFGLRAATRAPDRFGSLLAVGITTWITSQAVINIGAVIGVLPVTGIPLPFISFGGSSLIITMAAVGILLNIASHERAVPIAASAGGDVPPGRERPSGTPWWPGAAPPAICSRRWPSPRRWSTPGTSVAPSSSWARRAARTALTLEGRGFPFTLLPGRGIVRSLRPRDLAGQPRGRGRPGRGRGAGRSAWWPGPGPGWWCRWAGTPAWPPRWPRWSWGCPWCWSTWMPCPVRPTGCSGGSPGPAPSDGRAAPLPRAVVTGTPVRPEIAAVGRGPDEPAPRPGGRSGLPEDRPTVAVFGGSLGARRINRGGRRAWPTGGRTGTTGRSTTSSAGGTGTTGRPGRTDGRRRRRHRAGPGPGALSRTGWTWSTPPPTWWCAGPGP